MDTVHLGETILKSWGCLFWAPPWDPSLLGWYLLPLESNATVPKEFALGVFLVYPCSARCEDRGCPAFEK